MFSGTVFKQTFKSNIRLWLIFATILSAISCLIIAIFNPATMDQILSLMERLIEDPAIMAQISANFSLLNMLSMQFYIGMGMLLPLIYLIITANSLIASQVDRGSMAYILSTPIKRTTVVLTQAIYLVLALFIMFAGLTVSGMVTAQATHGGVFFRAFTRDVQAVATHLDMERAQIADDLSIIRRNPEAMAVGAEARGIDVGVYTAYLEILIAQQMGIEEDPAEQTPEEQEQAEEMQNRFSDGLEAAAEVLEMEVTALFFNLGLVKENPEALAAASQASELHEVMIVNIINMQLANEEVLLDNRVNFDIFDYLMMNLGIFLLMFATSGVSFLFSCLFNLTKNSMALGAGIPVAFYLFQTMASVSDDMEFFRFFTINTLYDPPGIIAGNSFWLQFSVLAAIGLGLYGLAVKIFKEKDLPL
ncbi:MAG: hypothetical protein FWE42_02820 [Defluviitaleaceae bacterium]|nr:hypothetical protein [Defluviitaleaceae bacterium]